MADVNEGLNQPDPGDFDFNKYLASKVGAGETEAGLSARQRAAAREAREATATRLGDMGGQPASDVVKEMMDDPGAPVGADVATGTREGKEKPPPDPEDLYEIYNPNTGKVEKSGLTAEEAGASLDADRRAEAERATAAESMLAFNAKIGEISRRAFGAEGHETEKVRGELIAAIAATKPDVDIDTFRDALMDHVEILSDFVDDDRVKAHFDPGENPWSDENEDYTAAVIAAIFDAEADELNERVDGERKAAADQKLRADFRQLDDRAKAAMTDDLIRSIVKDDASVKGGQRTLTESEADNLAERVGGLTAWLGASVSVVGPATRRQVVIVDEPETALEEKYFAKVKGADGKLHPVLQEAVLNGLLDPSLTPVEYRENLNRLASYVLEWDRADLTHDFHKQLIGAETTDVYDGLTQGNQALRESGDNELRPMQVDPAKVRARMKQNRVRRVTGEEYAKEMMKPDSTDWREGLKFNGKKNDVWDAMAKGLGYKDTADMRKQEEAERKREEQRGRVPL
jgi:hypothetical protein